jgi:type I restriction enzyme S subunit
MRIRTEDAEHQARWIEKPLGQCALIQTGVSKGRKMSPETLISVPYLRVANVQDGYLDLSEIKEIHVRPQDVPRYALQSGDVLLTEGGVLTSLAVASSGMVNCLNAFIKIMSLPSGLTSPN